jgi:hypothetical protein
LVVRGEGDAWHYLEKCLTGHLGVEHLVLRDWPCIQVSIDPGDGREVPPGIIRAHHLVQQAVRQGFALHKYGDVRRLTKSEREEVRVKLAIGNRSGLFTIDLAGALGAFQRLGDNGRWAAGTVLALGLMFSSSCAWAGWLNYMAETHKRGAQTPTQLELAVADKLSKDHVRRMGMLRDAFERSEAVRLATSNGARWRSALLDVGPFGGTIAISGVKLHSSSAKWAARVSNKAARAERKEMAGNQGTPNAVRAPWLVSVSYPRQLEPPMKLGAA